MSNAAEYIAAACAPVTYAEACAEFETDRLLDPGHTMEQMTAHKREALLEELKTAVRRLGGHTTLTIECAAALEPYFRFYGPLVRSWFDRAREAAASKRAARGPEPKYFEAREECAAWLSENEISGWPVKVFSIPEGDHWIAIEYVGDAYSPDTYAIVDEKTMVRLEDF